MPRIILSTLESFVKIVDDFSDFLQRKSYRAFASESKKKIVLIPLKSTEPILYFVFLPSGDELRKNPRALLEAADYVADRGVKIYFVEDVEWAADSPLGAEHALRE